MELELKGRVALVTGSTAGIGHAIAHRLAQEGAEVWVTGRTARRVEAAVAAIRNTVSGSRVQGVAADLETPEGAGTILEKLPFVHILVNNAGAFEAKPFPLIEDGAWTRLFELNVMSGVRLSRVYLPKMLAAEDGRIIFISSESAVQIPAEMIHYGVTKTAQAALARGLAELTVGSKVTVNSILVGPTRSEGVGEFVKQLAQARGVSEQDVERDFFDTARPTSLLRRFATPEEIASVVAFVASPLASAINGAALRADGGVVRAVF
jgi:NAD(P)-dependent dehydrogenase (short-subunit alcohol dehydrogenase family)